MEERANGKIVPIIIVLVVSIIFRINI